MHGEDPGHAGGAQVLLAPAKLTLRLKVVGVAPDGYHLLDAEMTTVSLADSVVVGDPRDLGAGERVTLVDEVVGGAGTRAIPRDGRNLACRALDAVGLRGGLRVVKRIPAGAGLGGGSADAAAVLRFAGVDDLEVALGLGADVPFCVRGGRARVGGVGEIVEPLVHEERSFVLLIPPVVLSTADVYRRFDADTRRCEVPGDGEGANDLERAAVSLVPALGRWRDVFGDVTGRTPCLAGSGSTWWVEGRPSELGLEGRRFLVRGHERAALVPVHSVPSGWGGAPATERGSV